MEIKKIVKDNTLKKIIPAVLLAVGCWVFYLLKNKKNAQSTYGIKGDAELTEARAQCLAEIMLEAMGKYGTNEKKVAEVYDELCKYDKAVLQVHEAFGTKKYLFGYNDIIGPKLNMRQWLENELSRKLFAQWNELYKKALNG